MVSESLNYINAANECLNEKYSTWVSLLDEYSRRTSLDNVGWPTVSAKR